jgi:hypothetical protein
VRGYLGTDCFYIEAILTQAFAARF